MAGNPCAGIVTRRAEFGIVKGVLLASISASLASTNIAWYCRLHLFNNKMRRAIFHDENKIFDRRY